MWLDVKRAAEEYSFFHWDLEFPDIFYNENGKQKENPGFDGVVGNPPYGANISKAEHEHHKNNFQVGSTDTAQLMIFVASKVLSSSGINGFIVPKAFVFASNWKNIRERLLYGLTTLIDCKKVWSDVKLEQIVYIFSKTKSESYRTGSRTRNFLSSDTKINKKLCLQFGFFLCGIQQNEISLGQKIHAKSEMLNKYVINNRGSMLQNKVKENGKIKVLGGAQIRRYFLANNVKGYINSSDINTDKAYVKKESILVQRIVTHVDNPIDHLKIIATIPLCTDFIILDTINQITSNKINPYYILGLLNSKLINWYAYRFIFAKAIRTMQFDNPTTNRIPIVLSHEKKVVELVKKTLQISQNIAIENTFHVNAILNELDHTFYKIFGLTNEDIQLVELSMPDISMDL